MRCILFSTILLLTGCSSGFYEVKYEPTSKNDKANLLIGNECELNKSWYLMGWENFDNNGVVDSYVLKTKGNSSSRHIVDRIKLSKNTNVKIISVDRNVTWTMFYDKYKFNLEISGQTVKAHKTEHIDSIELSKYSVCAN